MQTEVLATKGISHDSDSNSLSTQGVYTPGEGENLPDEPGEDTPVRLDTKGMVGDFTSVSIMSRGMTIQGDLPYPDPTEGYNPPRRIWSDLNSSVIRAVLSSRRDDDLGFEDFHDSIQFIDDHTGEIVRVQKPDGDRFRDLLGDDDFLDLLRSDFDRAFQIALNRFSKFDG